MDVGVFFLKFFMYKNRKRVKKVVVTFFCTLVEKAYIRSCAKKAHKSVSAYVRDGAVEGFMHKDKSLPAEVLAFEGQLAQVCGDLEVIARKRLDGDELNALERAQLSETRKSLQSIFDQIKIYLS